MKENTGLVHTFSSLRMRSLASGVRYGGKFNLPFSIFSIVFFRLSAVNGGYNKYNKKWAVISFRMTNICKPKFMLTENIFSCNILMHIHLLKLIFQVSWHIKFLLKKCPPIHNAYFFHMLKFLLNGRFKNKEQFSIINSNWHNLLSHSWYTFYGVNVFLYGTWEHEWS